MVGANSETVPTDDPKFYFRLDAIHVINFSIALHERVDIDSGLGSMEYKFHFTFDTQNNLASCKAFFTIFISKDPKDIEKDRVAVMKIEIMYVFQLLNLAKYISSHEGKQTLDTGVMVNMISVAYSTSRGIIYEKTRGYGINDLPLPILNVDEYVGSIHFNKLATNSPSVFEPPS